MTRLLVLVEGQTEETFVRDVLSPHLRGRNIFPTPVLLKTKRVKSGGAFRGGVTSTKQVLGDARRLLGNTAAAVTTIMDYYGLPKDFPGMTDRPATDPHARVSHVERAFHVAAAAGDPRFIPHLVLHEYEAWIYADPRACEWVFEDRRLSRALESIRDVAGGAERIDEGQSTAPSKRMIAAYPRYQKVLQGPLAVAAIGLPTIRASCPHADAWLARLETL